MSTIYRAVPSHVTEIRDGDWVAKDEFYCSMHADAMADWTGEPWHVISKDVSEQHVEWAGDRDEWHADTGEKREFFYRPALTSPQRPPEQHEQPGRTDR